MILILVALLSKQDIHTIEQSIFDKLVLKYITTIRYNFETVPLLPSEATVHGEIQNDSFTVNSFDDVIFLIIFDNFSFAEM